MRTANLILLLPCILAHQSKFWGSLWASKNLNRPALASSVVSGANPQQDTASSTASYFPSYNTVLGQKFQKTVYPAATNVQNSMLNNWFSNLWSKRPENPRPKPALNTQTTLTSNAYNVLPDYRVHNFRIKLSDFDCLNNTRFGNQMPTVDQIENLLLHSVDTYRLRTFGQLKVSDANCGSLIVDFTIQPFQQKLFQSYVFEHVADVRRAVARAIVPNYNGRTALDYAGTMNLGPIEHEPLPEKAPAKIPKDFSREFDSKITEIITPLVLDFEKEPFEEVVSNVFDQIKKELPDFDFSDISATDKLFSRIMTKIQKMVEELETENRDVQQLEEPLIVTDTGVEGVFENDVVSSIKEASESVDVVDAKPISLNDTIVSDSLDDESSVDMSSDIPSSLITEFDTLIADPFEKTASSDDGNISSVTNSQEIIENHAQSLTIPEDFIPNEEVTYSEPMSLTEELSDEISSLLSDEDNDDSTPVLDALENVIFEEITNEVDSVLNEDEGTLVPLVAAINEAINADSEVEIDIIETAKAINDELEALENESSETPILNNIEDTVVKTLYKEQNSGPLTDIITSEIEKASDTADLPEKELLDDFPEPASTAEVSQAITEAITDSVLLNSEIVDFQEQEQKILTDLEPFKNTIFSSAQTLVTDLEEGVDVMDTYEDIKNRISDITETVATQNNAQAEQAVEDASSQVIDLVLAVEERRRRR